MKTKILALLTFSLLLSACGTKTASPTTQVPTEPPKNVFTSIKDAVARQLLLKCEYTDEDGQKTTTFIKGKQVRLSGTDKQADFEGIIKDNKFYLWSKDKKQGMSFDLTATSGAKMGDTEIKSSDDVVNVLETKKENCQLSTESESIFEVPSDINFSDASGFFSDKK